MENYPETRGKTFERIYRMHSPIAASPSTYYERWWQSSKYQFDVHPVARCLRNIRCQRNINNSLVSLVYSLLAARLKNVVAYLTES